MASVNIMIKKEAYDFLTAIKGNQSYSDVILNFKKKQNTTLREFSGAYNYKAGEAEKRKNQINQGRQQANDRIRHLHDYRLAR